FRRSGFRASAEAFGAKVELEGKGGGGEKAETVKPGASSGPNPSVSAKGGSIAVGRDASGTFVAGDHNRVGPGKGWAISRPAGPPIAEAADKAIAVTGNARGSFIAGNRNIVVGGLGLAVLLAIAAVVGFTVYEHHRDEQARIEREQVGATAVADAQ